MPNARHPKFVDKIDHVQRAAKSLFGCHPPRSLDFFPKINIHFGFSLRYFLSAASTAMNAFCGICTWPTCFILALPFFCFSRSFFFRVTSPP